MLTARTVGHHTLSAIFEIAASYWQDMKQDYQRHVDHQYLKALEECSGVLVNKEGRAQGIDGFTLFSGPTARAQKYASEELLEFWEKYPRRTMAQFEEKWIQGMEFQIP